MNLTEINDAIANLKPDFYRDENGEPHAFFTLKEKIVAVPVRSKKFEAYVQREVYYKKGSYLRPRDLDQLRIMCNLKAEEQQEIYPLPIRVAKDKHGSFVYDLGHADGKQVIISPGGWGFDNNRVIFRESGKAPEPKRGGEIEMLFNYLNIKDPDKLVLTTVILIGMFIPDIYHPILVINGERGSGKSTISRIFKNIVDPSMVEVSHLGNIVVS